MPDSTEAQVRELISSLPYELMSFARSTRYWIALLRKEGRGYFFKTPLRKELNPFLLNEEAWHEQLAKIGLGLPVEISPVVNSGKYDGSPWFIRQAFTHQLFDLKSRKIILGTDTHVDKIVRLLCKLTTASIRLPLDELKIDSDLKPLSLGKLSNRESAVAKLREKLSGLESIDGCLRAIKKIDLNKQNLAHGDFVLWNFFVDPDKSIALVDSEYASNNLPKYVDISYLFFSCFAVCKQFELAESFLSGFRKTITDVDFESQFNGLIIWFTLNELLEPKISPEDKKVRVDLIKRVLAIQ